MLLHALDQEERDIGEMQGRCRGGLGSSCLRWARKIEIAIAGLSIGHVRAFFSGLLSLPPSWPPSLPPAAGLGLAPPPSAASAPARPLPPPPCAWAVGWAAGWAEGGAEGWAAWSAAWPEAELGPATRAAEAAGAAGAVGAAAALEMNMRRRTPP